MFGKRIVENGFENIVYPSRAAAFFSAVCWMLLGMIGGVLTGGAILYVYLRCF